MSEALLQGQQYTWLTRQSLVISLYMANTPPNTVPFVQAACVADSVLLEQDGVPSAIRIIDTFTIDEPPNMPPGIKPGVAVNVLISLKSGDVKGESQVELVLRPPSGDDRRLGTRPIVLEGGIHGAQMKVMLNVLGVEYGQPYWLDVLWGPDRVRLTSIPFRFKRLLRWLADRFDEKASEVSR